MKYVLKNFPFCSTLQSYVHLDETAVEHVVGGGGVEAGPAVAGVAAPHPAVPGLELALQPVQCSAGQALDEAGWW